MARPISGENRTYRIKIKQRNGGYYVYERTERYENGRMHKTGKDVLIGKILPNDPEETIVPTRPKRKPVQDQTGTSSATQDTNHQIFATRQHIG
jgi:hypothetical protein